MDKQVASRDAFISAYVQASSEDPKGNAWGKDVEQKYNVHNLYLEAIENENAPHDLILLAQVAAGKR